MRSNRHKLKPGFPLKDKKNLVFTARWSTLESLLGAAVESPSSALIQDLTRHTWEPHALDDPAQTRGLD